MAGAGIVQRVAGLWLVAGALVWIVSLAMHPPPPAEVQAFMELVASTGLRWVVVHWLAAGALSVFILVSLMVLTGRSRLTRTPLGLSGWAVLPVASIWVLTTAVMEATVMSHAAAAGDLATFEAWHVFAQGKAMGFLGISAAVGMIALHEARSAEAATPTWAARIGVGAAGVGFLGWILGPVLRLPVGGPMFVVSSVVFGLWLLWFGIGLYRQSAGVDAASSDDRRGARSAATSDL